MIETHQRYISGFEGGADRLNSLIDLAFQIKHNPTSFYKRAPLKGKVATALFLNPSLRTRTSMETALFRLGGHLNVLSVGGGNGTWGVEFEKGVKMDGACAEHIIEAAGVLSTYSDLLAMRSFSQMQDFKKEMQDQSITALADYASVPVLSLESARYHPCQGLADVLTLKEHLGDPRGKNFTLAWAPHPKMCGVAVPHSALLAAARLGMNVKVAHPPGYELDTDVMAHAHELAHHHGCEISTSHSLSDGCADAHVVYAKAWGSPLDYGQTQSGIQRNQKYQDWTLTNRDFNIKTQAFMHCLPVRRGVVVSDEILDSSASLVQTQAGYRLWGQMALLIDLLT
jgi:N-acetylornithine carbamoyltransferase